MSLSITTPQFVNDGVNAVKTFHPINDVRAAVANNPAVLQKVKDPAFIASAKTLAIGVAENVALAYALDSVTYMVNKSRAQKERDRRVDALRMAVQSNWEVPFSAEELDLLSQSVPNLRRPSRGQVVKSTAIRHADRLYRSVKISAWAYYGVYSSPVIVPVSAAAWGQYLAVKAVNGVTKTTAKVTGNKTRVLKAKVTAKQRHQRALARRRKMHSWVWHKTVGLALRRMRRLFTPFVWSFYKGLPEIEGGALVYYDREGNVTSRKYVVSPTASKKKWRTPKSAAAAARQADFVTDAGTIIETATELLNDIESVFTESKKITFEQAPKVTVAPVDEVKTTVATFELPKKDEVVAKAQAAAKDAAPKVYETVENWQLLLESAKNFNRTGFDRCQIAYETVLDDLPENVEIDDPRRLGSAMATHVQRTKRNQLQKAREALPCWILANLNEVDTTKLDDPDHQAAFIDFTDESGFLILQGWDDVVAKKLASV